MVGFAAVHSAVRNKRQSGDPGEFAARRREAAQARRKAEKKWKKLIQEFDKNNSGSLEHEQLKSLLAAECGQEVHDDEVDYYMQRFDKSHDGGINKNEIEGVLMSFHCYMRHKPQADELFQKYDKSGSGALEQDELKAMMTELNDGLPVTAEEVRFVLSEADLLGDGKIERPEVVRAVTIWYAHVEESKGCCALL
mmetsp:Transcript_12722/g.37035  ORF Transcript_12722/g.37035 Transcript_12722/m.37035 type:complete len:195 (+) Transcript_12722:52-636(+)